MGQNGRFLDQPCTYLTNGVVELWVMQTAGPRVLAFSLVGGENLFAELPGMFLEDVGFGRFHFWGGHRLWHAPEVKRRTYIPDDQPVTIREISSGLEVVGTVEVATGLQKSLRLHLPDDSATVVVDHILYNHGLWPVACAPWAITQLKPGGMALLPQTSETADPDGVQPNRSLALWPYTDINSPHITWGNRFIVVHSNMTQGALKLGFPNPAGWLAYHWRGSLFVKSAVFDPQATYFDQGASSQCYCDHRFLELETLAPRTLIPPGGSATHREVWRLFPDVPFHNAEELFALLNGQ